MSCCVLGESFPESIVERQHLVGPCFVPPLLLEVGEPLGLFACEVVDFGSSSAIYGSDPFGNVIELYEIRDERTAQLQHLQLRD